MEGLTYFIKNRGYDYAIYGAGRDGRMVAHWIEKMYGIKPDYFIDKNPDVGGGSIPVLSINDFENRRKRDVFVVIAVGQYTCDKKTRDEIQLVMASADVKVFYDAQHILLPFKKEWWHYIFHHTSEFEELFEQLEDEISKETLEEYLKTYILGQRYSGQCFPEQYKYWGIDTEEEKLFHMSDKEIVLNVGACHGDTLIQYLKCGNPYQKFIAVEGDKSNYLKLLKLVTCLGEEDKKRIQTDNLFLGKGAFTIDEVYGDEKISLINMDIEGSEMAVLETAKVTIRRNRPVLSICAYHKMDDLVVISQFIKKNFDNYIFALRKYPSSWWEYIDGIHQINELVLYAIPKERYCN